MRLTVIDEVIADPGQQVALRVINVTGAAIDVRQYVATGTVPAAADWSNVGAYSISTYKTVSPRPDQVQRATVGRRNSTLHGPAGTCR
jgi:hypothetical protein